MFTKRLLFLTNHHLLSVIWKQGRILDFESFPLTDDGKLSFSKSLPKRILIPTYILAELVEEDFRNDTIPHVIHRDRQAILDRKLSQLYRATHYRTALVQGRELEGRRDDHVLYTAITNPNLIKPWVDILMSLNVPLAGIYSVPLLSGDLLKTLRINALHVLLTSVEAGGGLRQSYFAKGELKFSRLTPAHEIRREDLPAFISDEVAKTWQYLDSLRYFTRADTLDAFILAHPDDATQIEELVPEITQLQYNVINICDVGTRVGLQTPLTDFDAAPIFLQLLGKRPPSKQFATHEETHGMRIWRARISLYMTSALILLFSAAWGGVNALLTAGKNKDIKQIETTIATTSQLHKAELKSVRSSSMSPTIMRNSVMLYEQLLQHSPNPTKAIKDISVALNRFPNIRLLQINWGLNNNKDSNLNFVAKSNQEDAGTSSNAPAQTSNEESLENYEIVIIEAEIANFTGNYREALNEIEKLQNTLNTVLKTETKILSSPVNLTPTSTLNGRIGDEAQAPQARFAIKIIIDHSKS